MRVVPIVLAASMRGSTGVDFRPKVRKTVSRNSLNAKFEKVTTVKRYKVHYIGTKRGKPACGEKRWQLGSIDPRTDCKRCERAIRKH